MNNYKRLTIRLSNGKIGCLQEYSQKDLINRLADLEDEIENGTLIELPCKVGDMLWEVNPFDEIILSITAPNLHTIIRWIEDRAFGEYLFLTKTEAEAKLKQLQGE